MIPGCQAGGMAREALANDAGALDTDGPSLPHLSGTGQRWASQH